MGLTAMVRFFVVNSLSRYFLSMTVSSPYCSGSGKEGSSVGYTILMVSWVRWGTANATSDVSRPVQAKLTRASRVAGPPSSGV